MYSAKTAKNMNLKEMIVCFLFQKKTCGDTSNHNILPTTPNTTPFNCLHLAVGQLGPNYER